VKLRKWFDIARLRVRSLLRRSRVESELERELRFHLEQETEANRHLGLLAPEAQQAARRRLGGVAQIQEECRDMRRTGYIENFIHDLQYAICQPDLSQVSRESLRPPRYPRAQPCLRLHRRHHAQ
jgi:macrolide transport system ATP-binding/permease protein